MNKLNVLHSVCDIDDHICNKIKFNYPDIHVTKDWVDILNNIASMPQTCSNYLNT